MGQASISAPLDGLHSVDDLSPFWIPKLAVQVGGWKKFTKVNRCLMEKDNFRNKTFKEELQVKKWPVAILSMCLMLSAASAAVAAPVESHAKHEKKLHAESVHKEKAHHEKEMKIQMKSHEAKKMEDKHLKAKSIKAKSIKTKATELPKSGFGGASEQME